MAPVDIQFQVPTGQGRVGTPVVGLTNSEASLISDQQAM